MEDSCRMTRSGQGAHSEQWRTVSLRLKPRSRHVLNGNGSALMRVTARTIWMSLWRVVRLLRLLFEHGPWVWGCIVVYVVVHLLVHVVVHLVSQGDARWMHLCSMWSQKEGGA